MERGNRVLWIFFGILLLLVVIGPLLMTGMMGAGGMMGPGTSWGYGARVAPAGGWGWAFGLHALMTLAFWGLVVFGIVLLGRGLGRALGGGPEIDSALDTLRRRYAAGEITEEEYQKMRQVLQR